VAPNDEQIYNAILGNVPQDGSMYTELQLRDSVEKYRTIFPISEAAAQEVLRKLQVQLSIKMDMGSVVSEQSHQPWLYARKAKIDQFFWERFRKQLLIKEKWPPLVVNTLDRVTDEILDLAGDPLQALGYKRKGLIVGDVQSGKTATYTAIACKAADAGYRLIVLLTGTVESLRRQTQIRLDEGFVGRDSSQAFEKNKIAAKSLVGVGLLDGRRVATAFTSRKQDFSKVIAQQLGFSIENSPVPVLMVCKKNAIVLENLRSWLETMNAQHGSIKEPLLLIDDEADSASINTSSDRENATRTNKEIRKLLHLFMKSTYVGVTATPFANVFIHPDTRDKMFGDDLFPSSFIYALEPPTNYIGPERVFSDGVPGLLAPLNDAEDLIPIKHKIDHTISDLPRSLLHATRCFVLATTIRDLRSEGPTHRSMLINVSRFTDVQERVREAVDDEVRSMQRQIRLYAGSPTTHALKSSKQLSALHDAWEQEFAISGFSWELVQATLNDSVAPITVTAVNQKSGASGLDYQAHKMTGLRVIAVGGNSLSRGLTLEGLSTSYFYRNSIMYDTLLQMGRWFGYRGSYSDLCRLFLSDDAVSWFSDITQATIDLREQLRRMQDLGQTPAEFGLKVRAHPDSLIVTARNKMRAAQDFVHHISLSGQLLETVRLLPKVTVLESNYLACDRFCASLASFPRIASSRSWYTFGPVPKTLIAQFLTQYISDPTNFKLQLEPIADFLLSTNEESLQEWDVSIVNVKDGDASVVSFAGLSVGPITRKLTRSAETSSLLISGTKARVGPGGAEQEGLTDALSATIKRQWRANNNGANVPDKAFREARQRPLLLIYLVRGYFLEPDGSRVNFRPLDRPLTAFGLSFPSFDDSSVATQVPYKINVVEWKARFAAVETDDQTDDFID
jgi:hypothetical protein